jgi:chromosome segregation ATPase
MKKYILSIVLTMISLIGLSQDYPRLEKDSLGNTIVILTLEQAQKLDNNMEILTLLEQAVVDCDNLNNSYLKVIDEQKRTIALLELDNKLLKEQIVDKDKSIANLQIRLDNAIDLSSRCETQKAELNGQVTDLQNEISNLKTKRNIGYGVGVLGALGAILVLIFK